MKKTLSFPIKQIDDRTTCQKRIKNGAKAAFLSAGITAAFGAAGLLTNPSDSAPGLLQNPELLFDAVLVAVLAFLVLHKNRIASTLLVIYFVGAKLILFAEVGLVAARGWPMLLLFLFYFVSAMLATYRWHAKYRNAPEDGPALTPQNPQH
ncbi:hypothetical protein KNO81_40545 [Paraburkholderia sediminicola]|nr:hypothetical protein [Paraburkholderia sediminicola]